MKLRCVEPQCVRPRRKRQRLKKRLGRFVQRCINIWDIILSIYARSTSAKLAVVSTISSLRGRTPDANIRHYITVVYAMLYLGIVSMVFVTACSAKETPIPVPAVSQESETASSAGTSVVEQETRELTRWDINDICNNHLFTNIFSCSDGSQIIEFGLDYENAIDIRYLPIRLPNGEYQFFQTLSPSEEISYEDDGSVVIPICINDSEDVRFAVSVHYTDSKHHIEIDRISFTFYNDEDRVFNERYRLFDYEARSDYRMSLVPDKSLGEEELGKFLRACAYHGNMLVLETLYQLVPDDDLENKYGIELASSYSLKPGLPISETNPYRAEIFYGESSRAFPQQDTLTMIAECLRQATSFEQSGAEVIEPNFDWESACQILKQGREGEFAGENVRTTAVYRLDLDHDGELELLIQYPGGSQGNLFWEVLHLDESGAVIGSNEGEGMGDLTLFRYHGDYFFLTVITDITDKQFSGWEVYAFSQNSEMYRADVRLEKTGSRIVFTDRYREIAGLYLDWYLDSYIDQYKQYHYRAIGTEIEPDEDLLTLFYGSAESSVDAGGVYGIFDFNNDGIDDWTKVFKYFPSTRYQYYCNYLFIDGQTKERFDFAQLTSQNGTTLRCVFPYQTDQKNYFLCVLDGDGNYIMKLIELKGVEPVELQSWLLSETRRIIIQGADIKKNRYG